MSKKPELGKNNLEIFWQKGLAKKIFLIIIINVIINL